MHSYVDSCLSGSKFLRGDVDDNLPLYAERNASNPWLGVYLKQGVTVCFTL